MKKNTAGQKWIVFAFDETDNTPKAGDAAQITAKVSKDGAAAGATTDANPTELESGYYAFDIDADETNGDYLVIIPVSSTGNIQVVGVPGGVWTTFPVESADSGSTQIARVGADGDTLETLSDEIAAVKAETALIVEDTNEVQGKLPTNKFMGSSDGADDDGNIAAILTDTGTTLENRQVTIATDVAGLDGDAMVGTDSAALASVLGAAVGASISADIAAIKTVADAVQVVTDNLADSATTIVSGTVSHDNTPATTTVFFSDDITEATADHYNGRIVIFTSGALQNQATDITDYALDTGEGKFTVTALTEAPADNVTFVIV